TSFDLPVINFSKLEQGSGTPEWESTRFQVKKAVELYGFFKASFEKIPEERREEILTGLEELFDLPTETKKLNLSKMPNGGYIGKTFFT
ncbi:2-oxoglutarate and iron-dependent oxygenase domain-containing protein, partial [Vibrio vulnificus]|nr:2-oxoglutarate and iron-dependent oxygenase domain-containing protein [Vibrio vulnificus]